MRVKDEAMLIGEIHVVERSMMPPGMAVLVSLGRIVVPEGLTLEQILELNLIDGRRGVIMNHMEVITPA